MRRFLSLLMLLLTLSVAYCQSPASRQRNTVFILDCTQSMNGYNGAPDIWASTKQFLKSELEKESRTSKNATITILPFQDKTLPPITVNPSNYDWKSIESTLDNYIKSATFTNICDAWIDAEKKIDLVKENYIVLMTDGVDNVGGNSQIDARSKKLAAILSAFCDKYANTKGFYVKLTENANITGDVLQAINVCKDISVVDAVNGIPDFGGVLSDAIQVNTRDLPKDMVVGFSNPGTFNATLEGGNNDYVSVSIKNGKISGGKLVLHLKLKDGVSLAQLNKIIGDRNKMVIPLTVKSNGVTISNPDLVLEVRAADLRTLTLANVGKDNVMCQETTRIRPFLWIKSNDCDTLRWDLGAQFNECAKEENSAAIFKLSSDNCNSNCRLLYNDIPLAEDSLILVRPGDAAIVSLVIPASEFPGKVRLNMNQVHSQNLDRINNTTPQNYSVTLDGNYKSKMSWLEWLCWSLLILLIVMALLWFLFIKKAKYPKFKRGVITISDPYYHTIRAKGARKIVITPTAKSQGFLDKVFKGKVIYHVNPAWPCEVEVKPSGKSMRFVCSSNQLASDPTPVWTVGETYKIKDTDSGSKIVELQVN